MHQREFYRKQDQHRGSSSQRGYGSKWQRARAEFLAENPWCAECQSQGRLSPATLVDHKIPHRGNLKLMWDRKNWQSMDDECHNQKRQRESMEVR